MSNTLTITDELATQLEPYQSQLGEILELGIREWKARSESGFSGIREVIEKLATLPDPKEILELRPNAALQTRINSLLEKNRGEGLSSDERREWDQIEYAEHLVRMAKLSATRKLNKASA